MKKILLYNTLTGKKELFKPNKSGELKIYVCGPTVYDYVHIGNGRVSVFFDVVRRYFEYEGYNVVYVQNITDVDDKIIEAAKKSHRSELEISKHYSDVYLDNLKSLNVIPSHVHPKVSDHIKQIVSFIEKLIKKGIAYEMNGDVYYRVETFENYGKLSNQKLDSLKTTDREVAHVVGYKENQFDFALWKKRKGEEVSWESPWGEGRPGWHIECSAMSMEYLGESFDIHGGGIDLCFPHHENEIAQSEALTGKSLANYWLHNNYVTVEGQKMSKSVGNFTTIQDTLEKFDGETIRFFYLSTNYRNTIDYSEKALVQSKKGLEKVKKTIYNLSDLKGKLNKGDEFEENFLKDIAETKESIINYLSDDFNTADTISLIFEFTKKINTALMKNKIKTMSDIESILNFYKEIGSILGLTLEVKKHLIEEKVEELIAEREELKKRAKETKDFSLYKKADAIREELSKEGIVLEDTVKGVRWVKRQE